MQNYGYKIKINFLKINLKHKGTLCQTKIPLCIAEPNSPCFNGGSCQIDKCVCASNFTGERCQTYSNIYLVREYLKIYKKNYI